MSLTQRLHQLNTHQDKTSWSPERFDLSQQTDRDRLDALLSEGVVREVCDTIELQLMGLMKERHAPSRPDDEAQRALAREHLGGTDPAEWGNWFFYPWSGRLVHVLPEDEYQEVRTRRNCYKITPEEQARLREAVVGIVGLSVGRTAAGVFALEGIGGEIRLADFDHLDLSNLNRLRGGAHSLGINKAVLAARELYELNPYLTVVIEPRGIQPEGIDAFLTGLSVLIEECDSVDIKFRLRERARDLRIPVIMDTSDRGLLDIERYDLEPDRPPFHGLIGDLTADDLANLGTDEKVPILIRLLGGNDMSLRMAASLPEIGRTIGSWPQLASDVTLGGAITACAARRLLLGEAQPSGRYYVDADQILEDGGVATPAWEPETPCAEAREERRPPPLRPVRAIDGEAVRTLVAWGTLAPSPHNLQPWRFVRRGDVVECWRDPSRALERLEFRARGMDLSIGCAVENMVIAGAVMGLRVTPEPFPDPAQPDLAARLTLRVDATVEGDPALAALAAARCSNRRRGSGDPIAPETLSALAGAAEAFGARLYVVTDRPALLELGDIIGEADRQAMTTRPFHHDLMGGMRWTPSQVMAGRDGLDVDTLELSGAERAAMQMLSHWPLLQEIRRVGRGEALAEPARQAMAVTSAAVLLVAPGPTPADYLAGGRALQRVWLAATAHRLAVHPWGTMPFLLGRLEHGAPDDLSPDLRQVLPPLAHRWHTAFGTRPGAPEVMFLRLSHAGPPSAISLRRPLDEVLTGA